MDKLRQSIQKKASKGLCTLKQYNNTTQIAEMVLKDLQTAIEKDFPILQYEAINTE